MFPPQDNTAIRNMQTGCCWYGSMEQSWRGWALLKNFTKASSAQARVKLQVQEKKPSFHALLIAYVATRLHLFFLCEMTETKAASLLITNKHFGAQCDQITQSHTLGMFSIKDSNLDAFPAWPHGFHGATSLLWSLGGCANLELICSPLCSISVREMSKRFETENVCLADKFRMEDDRGKIRNCIICWE